METNEDISPSESKFGPVIDTNATALLSVVVCFMLSGFAALLYQTVWLRQFSIAFGTSELAVATVLAAYMAGLAAGAIVADRIIHRIRRPVLVYGLLEAGIAVTALSVPLLLNLASLLYIFFLGGQPEIPDGSGIEKSIFYLIVTFVVLALPTGFMGATLPLLTRHAVRSDEHVGPRVALLYATNTIGAVLGTLMAAFVLLPSLGLNGTIWVGVLTNFLVFLVAAQLATSFTALDLGAAHRGTMFQGTSAAGEAGDFLNACVRPWFAQTLSWVDKAKTVFCQQPAWILPIMCLSGVSAFYYEVLWTRLLSHVLGGSVFAFATMLASFLTGIAIGGGLAGRFAHTRRQAVAAFIVTQIAIAIGSIGTYVSLDRLIPDEIDFASRVIFAGFVMLPSTIFIGATFPLAVRVLTPNEAMTGNCTARVYAWNTMGGIAGAILAGFWLIPLLGFVGSIKYVVLANLLLALAVAILIARARSISIALPLIAVVAVVFVFKPTRPEKLINASYTTAKSHVNYKESGREIYYAVGRSATVLMREERGKFKLRANGLPEAAILAKGTPPGLHVQKWLTAMPAVARPDAESMLVVGLGGGVALEGVPPTVMHVDVIELEPRVIEANRAISHRRQHDPLGDKRFNIVINDARSALALTDKSYDIIVSQPSHPWTAGASHLYTREFVQIVHQHLQDNGVFVQWISWQYIDEELLKILAATLLDSFEYVRLYQHDRTVLHFLASDAPLNVEQQIARSEWPLHDSSAHYSALAANTMEDVLVALSLDETGLKDFVGDVPINTDNHNYLAMQSRLIRSDYDISSLSKLLAPFDPFLKADSWIYTDPSLQLDIAYLVSRMLSLGFSERAKMLLDVVPTSESNKLLLQALIFSDEGQRDETIAALKQAVAEDPDNLDARYMLVRTQLAALTRDNADKEIQELAAPLEGVPRAIVDGWKFLDTQNWNALYELDQLLAQSAATDLWLKDTARLRAQWRTMVATPLLTHRMGSETIEILDRAIVAYPIFELYMLRLAASEMVKDPYGMAETAFIIGRRIDHKLTRWNRGEYRFSRNEVSELTRHIGTISKLLAKTEFDRVIHHRVNEIKSEFASLTRRLQAVEATL